MNILFLGGDARMSYAAAVLSRSHDISFDGGRFPVIVLPVPLTKNGSDIFSPTLTIPMETVADHAAPSALVLAGGECDTLTALCSACSLRLVNYFSSETLTLRNAALTAESAVCLLAQSTDASLLGARALITGFGRISRELAYRLAAFGSRVTVAARRREARAEALLHGFETFSTEDVHAHISEFDFIVNTVPAPLFNARDFSEMRDTCVFLELASLPPLSPAPPRYIHASGLPGRYSPKTAGEYIAEELLRYL